jgi:hypothetical protein
MGQQSAGWTMKFALFCLQVFISWGRFAEENKYFHCVTVAIFPGFATITPVGESPTGVGGARRTFSHSDASPSLTPTFDRVSLTLSESCDWISQGSRIKQLLSNHCTHDDYCLCIAQTPSHTHTLTHTHIHSLHTSHTNTHTHHTHIQTHSVRHCGSVK